MAARQQLDQAQKLDIWKEIGRQHGCPLKGTPDYEAKKDLYHAILHEEEEALTLKNDITHCEPDDNLPSDEEAQF